MGRRRNTVVGRDLFKSSPGLGKPCLIVERVSFDTTDSH